MPKESKESKFRRLAEKRVNVVIDGIRILSNLSNSNLYDYTDVQVKQIFDAVDNAVKKAKLSFSQKGIKSKERFIMQ